MNDDMMLGRGATAAFATRKPCKHGSLICFECEPMKEPTMIRRFSRNQIRDLIAKALTNEPDPEDNIGDPKAAESFANAIEDLWNTDEGEYDLSAEDLIQAFGHVSDIFGKLTKEMHDLHFGASV